MSTTLSSLGYLVTISSYVTIRVNYFLLISNANVSCTHCAKAGDTGLLVITKNSFTESTKTSLVSMLDVRFCLLRGEACLLDYIRADGSIILGLQEY